MKLHTTNYYSTLIQVSEDCQVETAQEPTQRKTPTIATIQFQLITSSPYIYTSDDVLFLTNAIRKRLPQSKYPSARQIFFSKGQPCFRASPLTKTYGWGVHFDDKGKMALVEVNSEKYRQLSDDDGIIKVKAMRSTRRN